MFIGILLEDMSVRKQAAILILVISILFMGGCEAIDEILPSAGTYKLNININDTLLDDCSYVMLNDSIHPSFFEPVSRDQDVTALMVYLRNASGDNLGWRVIYGLERNVSLWQGDSSNIIMTVKNLDDNLPSFKLPSNLPSGIYTIISQVMSGKNILQRTEKLIYYLGDTDFAYNGISVNLPGITGNSHLIPTDTVILLEADMNSLDQFNPYVVWYEGRKKVGEGYFSDGAGQFFWKAPEQSGFFSLSAEIFPVKSGEKLPGYKKEVSLIISSIAANGHLVSENIPQLVHWYTFENNFYDSKMKSSVERSVRPAAARDNVRWMGVNGTYGPATGDGNVLVMPEVNFSNDAVRNWQTLFRFKPINAGSIFTVQFGSSKDVNLTLSMEGSDFILSLSSPDKKVSQVISLPAALDETSDTVSGRINSFITAGLYFSVTPGSITAKINITGNLVNDEQAGKSIFIEADAGRGFQILLGSRKTNTPAEAEFNAIWDEFALYYNPPVDIINAHLVPVTESSDEITNN